MAGPQATIRSFETPLRGPGRSAPSLLEDLLLFDLRQTIQPGYHLLEDGARSFARSQFIGQLLPPSSCTHNFGLTKRQSAPPLIDEKPTAETIWQVAAVCQKCRTHLLLQVDYRAAWQDHPCPNYENPLHYLVRSPWRQDQAYRELARESSPDMEVHVYECSSRECSAVVTLQLTPPCFTSEALHILLDKELLAKRTNAAFEWKKGDTEGMKRPLPIDVLMDLRAYIRNAWRQDAQTQISLDNKRFIVRFGPEGKACGDVLKMLGFELKAGEAWIVPRPDLKEPFPIRQTTNVWLDNIEAELDALIANRPPEERQSAQDRTKPESALSELSRALSCQNYDKDPSSRTSKHSLLQRPRSFTILGIPEDASDDLIIWAYQRQMALETDAMHTAQLMTALEDVQTQRQSEKLSEQVAIEWSQGRYGEQAIADAYKSLGLPPDNGLDEESIIGTFEARLLDSPSQGPEMRESLARIGEVRNSQRLIDYARNELATYDDALHYLGAEHSTDDQYLVAVYTAKVSETRSNAEMAQKAMQLIAATRNSEQLKAFVAAGCQGELEEPKMDIGEAFNVLQIEDRTVPEETLLMVFQMRCDEDAPNKAKYRKAIETIAYELQSSTLKEKLEMPGGHQPQRAPVPLTEPIGLDNIGNTCYLNSLLQSLFTIAPIREIVLNFDDYKQSLDLEQIKAKRVGQRLVYPKEVDSAQNFVRQLGALFTSMIRSPDRAIRPAQELARLTLETGLVKQGRRSSTLQSHRRPTLGMIDSRPVFGPLPQSAVETQRMQPLQSPTGIAPSDEQVEHLEVNKNPSEDNSKANGNADNTTDANEEALFPHPEAGSDTATTKEEYVPNLNVTTNGVPPEDAMEDVVLSKHQTSGEIEQGKENNTEMQGPSATPESTADANAQHTTEAPPIYKPPEGKPPPVPPRPLATATLEQYARQQDVSEVLGHAIFQLSCAIRPRGFDKTGEQQDEIHDTLYGEEQFHTVRDGTASPQPPVQFLFLNLPIFNEPKDVYAALDNEYDLEPRGDIEIYKTITKLPPVLCMVLGRVIEDARGQHKINCHVDIPSTVYMDRYMDAPVGSTLVTRRAQTWQYKKELRKLQARIDRIEPKGKPPVDEVLDTAIEACQHLAEVGATENLDGLEMETEALEQMVIMSQQIKEEREVLKARIHVLEQQIKDSFTDAAFCKQEYKLHAAFFHRGTVGSGHYWVYIFDHVNEIWRKYNDDHVTRVTNLKEIFGNPRDDRSNPNWSSFNPANPYFLVYVRSDETRPEDNIVQTVVRNPILPPPPDTAPIDEGFADGPIESETNLRPLGYDANEGYANTSHHEFAGYQSQMTYMPPDAPRIGGQQTTAPQDEGFVEDWKQEDSKQAIGQSLPPETANGWDNSQNTSVPPHNW